MSLNHIFNRSKALLDDAPLYNTELHTFNGLTFDQDLINDGRIYTSIVNNRNYLLFNQENGFSSVLSSALQRVYFNLDSITVTDTQGEISLITYNNYIGTPLLRVGGSTRVGRTNVFKCGGKVTVSAAGRELRLKIKLGTIILVEKIITLTNLQEPAEFRFENKLIVLETGSAGTAKIRNQGSFAFDDQQGNNQVIYLNTSNTTTFETLSTLQTDFTCEWVTRNNGNNIVFEDVEFFVLS